MKQLWNDVSMHRLSASCFLLCWLAIFVYSFGTWNRGMSDLAVLLHLAAPVCSGAMVAWWRFPSREGLLVNHWRPAGPPLSGIIVAFVTVSAVFFREAALAVASGRWRLGNLGGFLLGWVLASAILSAIAAVLALFGAVLSRPVAARVKKGRKKGGDPAA